MEKPLNEERKTNTKYKIQKQFIVIFCQSKTELCLEVKGFFFFQGFLRKHINCVLNCEDNSSFDFISAVLMYIIKRIWLLILYIIYFIYICHMYLYYKCPTEVYFTGYHERVAVLIIME